MIVHCFSEVYNVFEIYFITGVSLSEAIRIRLFREAVGKLGELADKVGKNVSILIRELLERVVQEENLDNAVGFRKGRNTGWRATQLAKISLWNLYRLLGEKEGISIQYLENYLEEDLSLNREMRLLQSLRGRRII